jgi:uncharacterized FAD-dependent dehydrogenase
MMLILPFNPDLPLVFGIQISQSYPKALEFDISSEGSEYSWEKKFRDPYIIPKLSKSRYTKLDYYIVAFGHEKQYTLKKLIKRNGINEVINHIDDLNTTQKEFLKLQLC